MGLAEGAVAPDAALVEQHSQRMDHRGFQRPLGAFLPLHLGQIARYLLCRKLPRLSREKRCLSGEMAQSLAQRGGGEDLAGLDLRGLRSAAAGAEEGAAFLRRGQRRRQRAIDLDEAAVKRQFPQRDGARRLVRRQ